MYDCKCIEIVIINEWTIRLIIGSDVRDFYVNYTILDQTDRDIDLVIVTMQSV